MKKKSYNPFKMWGSYVGLTIISLVELPMKLCLLGACSVQGRPLLSLVELFVGGYPVGILYFVASIFWMAIGFLIGWAIHSLIRKLRRAR
jgi:hypothetical protein